MFVRALILSKDPAWSRRIRGLLTFEHVSASDSLFDAAAIDRLAALSFDVAIVDRAALAEPFKEALASLVEHRDEPGIVVLSRTDSPNELAQLIAAGANAVLSDLATPEVLEQSLNALVARWRRRILERLKTGEQRPDYRLADFASYSPAMSEALKLAERVARADTSLLICGETGVGKEWMARAIHASSRRSAGPFIAVNCAAIPPDLLESELFGHEKGSFTGAVRAHRGYFELAHGGTLLLDEIGDMSPMLQAKLLRVLQDKSVRRVGAESSTTFDVRILAATHRDLAEEIEAERFREDLYYRLAVVTLEIPPLRRRQEDIPYLANNHLEKLSSQIVSSARAIDEDSMAALVTYSWPGNVRELINVMERAVLLCDRTTIGREHLPAVVVGERAGSAEALPGGYLKLEIPDWKEQSLKVVRQQAVDAVERIYLSDRLSRFQGRIDETARSCGIDPRSVYEKMKRLDLDKDDFKAADSESL